MAEGGRQFGNSTTDLAAWTPPPKAKGAKKASKKKPLPPDVKLDDDITSFLPGSDHDTR